MSNDQVESIQEVRAEVLAGALTQDTDRQLFSLRGAKVLGTLNLKNCTIHKPVEIHNCLFEDGVDLRYCEFEQVVDFSGCRFRDGFNSGDGVEAHTVYKKDLICNKSVFEDAAKFTGIRVEGSVYLSEAEFLGEEEAIDFSFASLGSNLVCDRAAFEGGANFNSLSCDNYGIFNNARFQSEEPIDFSYASFDGNIECGNATFEGGASFNSLKCRGSGYFNNAQFLGQAGVDFTGASFDRDLHCAATIEGPARFAKVRCRDLYCTEAVFKGGASFNSLRCDNHGFFNSARFQSEKPIDFSYASYSGNFECVRGNFEGGVSFNSLKCGGSGFFRNAQFQSEESIDFSYASFSVDLYCESATFTSPVRFDKVECSDLHCIRTIFEGGASFNSLKCRGSGYFNNAQFLGQAGVDFTGASFDRDLYCQGVSFQGTVTFNSLKCDGDGRFDSANGVASTFAGEANFAEASFGMNLYCNGATFEGGASFNSLRCGNNGFFNSANFQGQREVDFSYAFLGRNLEYNTATFEQGANFNRLACEGTASFSHAHFLGNRKVNLGFTRFGSSLDLSAAKFGGAVEMTSTSISRQLILTGAEFQGEITLYNASINVLVLEDPEELGDEAFILEKPEEDLSQQDSAVSRLLSKVRSALGPSWTPEVLRERVSWNGFLDLRECTFNRFRGPDEQANHVAEAQDPRIFSQDPYLQLERHYENIGNDTQARKMYYQGRRALRENAKDQDSSANWTISRRFTDLSLKWLTGYGVRTWRLLVPISIFIIIGMWVFWSEDALLLKVPATSNGPPQSTVTSLPSDQSREGHDFSDRPVQYSFDRATFSISRFLPVVNLRVADEWEPNGLGREAYVFAHSLLGWILVPLLIASLAGIIRRR